MTTPFIGEIQLFGFNFAPRGWAFCNGALLPIQQNSALFSLLGTEYGGDGHTTFQLPNFAARAACSQGTGIGLTPRVAGDTFGEAAVTLTLTQMPSHTHAFTVYNQNDPSKRAASPSTGNSLASPTSSSPFASGAEPDAQFAPAMIGPAGGSQAHENQQPYLAVNFSIALAGEYPSFGG
ncbi:microcystin-dependent protein [Mesorhizobium plurifarium]|jgi:microcystin-dependent protein|uniref:phage tail protein n=1 Tax=Sinorhizobium TaxID=28105 RepID=UPI0003FFD948|nr:tail fiber protein [Sinorhizobium arboris]PST24109.1 microcystin-dependent protein [Mesorhizobium plurifarium]GCA50147.1 phage Tail Collar Domain protein [Sinorhizobium sp. KGO-5]